VVSYRGPAAEREQLFARRMRRRGGGAAAPWPFHVALTSYNFIMGKADRPRLASIPWAYIVRNHPAVLLA
jgi:SWI/SNF-related matrix-associated actin-dependent regulator of chromatin subfamily A protein 2/4